MRLFHRFLLVGCLLSSSHVMAASNLGKSYDLCMDNSNGVTTRMIECISTEHQRQDGLLNQNYQKRMADLSNDRKTKLRDVQRKWIAYRDANCQFYADPDGGSLARVEANTCLMRMTAARAEELAQAVSP